jgi:hypothetical protein
MRCWVELLVWNLKTLIENMNNYPVYKGNIMQVFPNISLKPITGKPSHIIPWKISQLIMSGDSTSTPALEKNLFPFC